MEPKDYLSFAALLISAASFFVSYRSYRIAAITQGFEIQTKKHDVISEYLSAEVLATHLKGRALNLKYDIEKIGNNVGYIENLQEIHDDINDKVKTIELHNNKLPELRQTLENLKDDKLIKKMNREEIMILINKALNRAGSIKGGIQKLEANIDYYGGVINDLLLKIEKPKMKACPGCAENINFNAKICRYCRTEQS